LTEAEKELARVVSRSFGEEREEGGLDLGRFEDELLNDVV